MRHENIEEELQRLRDRIIELEDVMGWDLRPALSFCLDLQPQECAVLAMLCKREMCKKEQIFIMLYSQKNVDERPEPKIVDVLVSRIRKKLDPLGIEIKTLWGEGLAMEKPSRLKLMRHCEERVMRYMMLRYERPKLTAA